MTRRASKYLVFNATVNRFDQTEISRTADDIDETHGNVERQKEKNNEN